MRSRLAGPGHPVGRVNITPMIDVIMCLIVFFLIVGKLVADQRSDLRLPPASAGEREPAQDLLVINVLPAEGAARVVIDGVPVAHAALVPILRAQMERRPATVVQVRASRDLRYGHVRPVLDACRSAGVPAVRLAAEQVP
jgi:biopolymer transport protein ExbD